MANVTTALVSPRLSARRVGTIMVSRATALLVCLAVLVAVLAGCAERQLLADDEEAARVQAELDAQSSALAAITQRYEQAIAAGVASDLALADMRAQITAETDARVAAALAEAAAAGVPLPDATAAARAQLESRLVDVGHYRGELASARADAAASDAAWLGLGGTLGQIVGSLVPGAGGAIVAALGMIRWGQKQKGRGLVIGAEAVRNSVRAAREADPAFNAMFGEGSTAAVVMRTTLDASPLVADVVRQRNRQQPKRPSWMPKP